MRFLFAFFLITTSYEISAANFENFQKILSHSLHVNDLEEKGWYTAFDYQALYNSKPMINLLTQQKEILKKFDIKTLNNKQKANAFWINAYNFFMIDVVLSEGMRQDELKIKSVKELGGFLNPYRIFKEKKHNIGGKKYSLDDIEKGILLGEEFSKKKWKDARIHFAVNCASVGCPPLHPQIYQAETLSKTLDDNIRKSLKSERHLKVDGETLYLTHLFKWYEDDFVTHSGSVREFIGKFIKDKSRLEKIKKTKIIDYIEYDWKLNIPANFVSQ